MGTSTAVAVVLTGAGGIAEVAGFVKLSAELRRARGGDELGWVRRRFHNWNVRRRGLAHEVAIRTTGGGRTIKEVRAGFTADAVIVEEVPPPGDTIESKLDNVLARLTNVEVQHGASSTGQSRERASAKAEIAHVREQGHVTDDRLSELAAETRRADKAEEKARLWFIAGVILATLGGLVGTIAQSS